MKIIVDKNNIIQAIGTDTTPMNTEAGVLWLDGAGFALFGQKMFEVENVPEYVTPCLYTYDGTTFAPYVSEIDRIKQEAIDEFTLSLIEEGVI